jgi:amino acid adenylation domain-containing protein/thioester reductase-like protein
MVLDVFLIFVFNMVLQSLFHQEEVDDEIENAFSDIHSTGPHNVSSSSSTSSLDIPSTHLPVLTSRSKTNARLSLAKSLPYAPLDITESAHEIREVLAKTWAILLHQYAVSDTVTFAVIGQTTGAQLVVSRWSSTGPQLRSIPFNPSQHGNRVNTALDFNNIHHASSVSESQFSYILHWSKEVAGDLRLYTVQPSVPPKYASALWTALLEIHAAVGTADPALFQRPIPISKADQRAIASFTPITLFEERQSLHGLFLRSARATPHAAAVHGWDGQFTYAELDRLSSVVASQLLHRGIGRGKPVPFIFEKSVWMVVAILGILKAGGAVVAIDPTQPLSRASAILRETGATVVLTSTTQASKSNLANLIEIIPVSSDTVRTNNRSPGLEDTFLPTVHTQDPAVIIFTSGSTGKPKGIVIQHGAIATRMVAEGRAFQYHGARTLQFAASTWDIFMTDIFTTLTFNGCVCIPSEEDRRFNLAKFCTEFEVSLALITPTLANLLSPGEFPTLRTLIFGGEALREEVVAKWENADQVTLYQGYGPAETGPCIAARLAERPEILGYALDNSVCVLVSPQNPNQVVPLGAIGELVVSGPSLLREYLNDTTKTDDAVIEDPAWAYDLALPVKRFYRTGDLLRYSIDTLDGRFEFVGRKDDQVKYHGQRIELREIEHHLGSLPGADACLVVLVKEGYFKDRLVAVVQQEKASGRLGVGQPLSVRPNSTLTLTVVRDHLSSRLPSFMIPNELLVVDALPHNSSMKLDRALVVKWISGLQSNPSLQKTARQKTGFGESQLQPHESTARVIAREYADIVAGEIVSRRHEYEGRDFNLQDGGIDSIQIMSLSMRLTELFGFQVPMNDLLSSKATVRSIAAVIDANTATCRGNGGAITALNVQIPLRSAFPDPALQTLSVDARRVFLTGATGFLGIEILRQLLALSTVHVYTLVRATKEAQAEDRLIQKAVSAGWWKPDYNPRLHVWQGDLTQPQLGLNTSRWQMLQGQTSESIDVIIHNGAKVHYTQDYETLKKFNVSPTVELLKAVHGRDEPLHSFVFVSGGTQLGFDEGSGEKNTSKALRGSGYSRSKAVAEQVVRRFANQQGAKAGHVRIVKPGFIIGDAERGVSNQSDFIWRIVAASVEIGAYIEEEADGWLFVSDITRVAGVILRSALEDHSPSVAKVLDGLRFKTLWTLLHDQFGFDLQPITRSQWLQKVQQSVSEKREKHPLFPLLYQLEASDEPIGVLDGAPLAPSAGVTAAIEANITHLIRAGFLRRPDAVWTPSSSQDTTALPVTDAFDVQSLRKEFPALNHGVVPFNNAAGTVLHREASEATHRYMTSFPYELGRNDPASAAKTQRMDDKFKELAAFMNAEPDEIGTYLPYAYQST